MLELDDLVTRCRRGEDLAWEALVRRLQGRVFGIAFQYMRDREEARDMAQDIFVRIYRKLHTLEEGRPFLPWMMRVARNCCIDRLRHLRLSCEETSVPLEELPDHAGTDPTPEETCLGGDRERLVYRALGFLSDTNREMILLKEIQGLKMEEIAELLAVPLGTVKSRSNRARIELGKALCRMEAG